VRAATLAPALLLAALALSLPTVLPTESGDAFYFAHNGLAGAINAFGQVLWSVPGELIASDPMGSCLAVTFTLRNATGAFAGTLVSLYAPDGRLLWAALVKINATALATDCVRVAVGGQDGAVAVLADGRVVSESRHGRPVVALAFARDGRLLAGTGDPLAGFTSYVDRCGNTITALKSDAPYLVVRSPALGELRYRGGLAPMLRVPAAASQDCRALVYAVYDALYNGTRPLARLPLPVIAVAVSGDGRAAAAATAERIYVIREGRAVAEIEARMARSVALSWDGLAMAYATDTGVRVQRFRVARIEARGCPLPATARVGNITYSPPVDALVPAEAAEVFAEIVEGPRLRCVPVQNATRLGPVTVIEYRVEYRVDAPPLVSGPRWASGPAAFYAPPEVRVRADPPLGEVVLALVDWEVNGTRRGAPMPSIVLEVNGPTRVEPVYELRYPPEVVAGNAKYAVRAVTLLDAAGRPVARVSEAPAYARVHYEVYRALSWRVLDNASTAWLRPGERALLRAPPLVDLGNGTRLAFRAWSAGERQPEVLAGPGHYEALYDVYYAVSWSATNFSLVQWVPRGAPVRPPPVSRVYDDGMTRVYVAGWRLEGVEVQFPVAAGRPLNFTAAERREFRVALVDWDERREAWMAEGAELDQTPRRKWLLWYFSHWEPAPLVAGPGTYTAVYRLDVGTVAALAAAAAAALAVHAILRRK
jgi:hypothetical protein